MAALLIPAAGSAQVTTVREYFNRCTTGTLHACASLEVRTTNHLTGGTQLVIKYRNDQGSNTWFDNMLNGSRLGVMEIHSSAAWRQANPGVPFSGFSGFPNINPFPAGIVATDGPVGNFGVTHGLWGGLLSFGAGSSSDLFVWHPAQTGNAIFGCTVGAIPFAGAYSTCARDGLDGWVTMTFETWGTYTADDVALSWSTADFQNNSASCSTDTLTGCATVTPEPMTVILLGTGLAGIAGVARRRRRSE